MNKGRTYHTRQQDAILQYMEQNRDGCITVGQIADYLKERGESVGLTTIYRHLNRFMQEGILRKTVVEGSAGVCYQYVGEVRQEDGFLLKCENCGEMVNMGCDHMTEFYEHVLEEHHFHVNPVRTVFYGTCRQCLETRPAVRTAKEEQLEK